MKQWRWWGIGQFLHEKFIWLALFSLFRRRCSTLTDVRWAVRLPACSASCKQISPITMVWNHVLIYLVWCLVMMNLYCHKIFVTSPPSQIRFRQVVVIYVQRISRVRKHGKVRCMCMCTCTELLKKWLNGIYGWGMSHSTSNGVVFTWRKKNHSSMDGSTA